MNSLLDTNVVSEYQQSRPDPRVMAWLAGFPFDSAFLSVVSLSEIRMGVERLASGRRRAALELWLVSELPLAFDGRLLPVTDAVADCCGVIRAKAFSAGRPMAVMDAFLAATADVHALTLVTRNVRDFEIWGGPVFNPWDG